MENIIEKFKEKNIWLPLNGIEIFLKNEYDTFKFIKIGFFYIDKDSIKYFETEISYEKKIKLISL